MLSEKVPLFPKELAIFLFDTFGASKPETNICCTFKWGKEQNLETLDLLIEPLQVPDNADR